MHPATNGALAQKKAPRVLRWIIVALLLWLVTGGYFLVSAEVTIWSRTFGSGEATADPVAHVELDQGQPFGLAAQRDKYVKCQVIPQAGEAREFIPGRPANGLRSSRLPGPQPAWFSGPAVLRCTGPTTVLLPERYDKTGRNVLYALITASSLVIVVVLGANSASCSFQQQDALPRLAGLLKGTDCGTAQCAIGGRIVSI